MPRKTKALVLDSWSILAYLEDEPAAQKVAEEMAEEHDMQIEWDGDVLKFKRSGVSGTLTVLPKEAHMEVTLGFMLKMFSSTIEEQISKNMKKVFSGKA